MSVVTAILASEDRDLLTVAKALLLPDQEARGRLFQLACVGLVLRAARESGAVVVSRRPIGIGAGPSYDITDRFGRHWDLWVEAGGMYSYYRTPSPYTRIMRQVAATSTPQPLGADLVLVIPGERALVVECKYSADLNYVTRNGYEQALAYQAEVATTVAPAEAVVVGPDDVVPAAGVASTVLGRASIIGAAALGSVVESTLLHQATPS